MMLVEQGKIRLTDRVAPHLPGFERYGKRDITIRHLLTHTSGLRPDLEFNPEWNGYHTAISTALDEVPVAGPDERVIYPTSTSSSSATSSVSFPANRSTSSPGSTYSCHSDEGHDVQAAGVARARIAPTERSAPISFPCGQDDGTWLRGVVHDPTARRMNNVAGHAGPVHDGGRSRAFRADAPQRGTTRRRPHPFAAHRRAHDVAVDAGRRTERPRTGVGHQLQFLGQQGRPAAGAFVRSHGFHRHLVVD